MSSLLQRARAAGLAAGLDAVGVAGAAAFDETRRILEQRRSEGLAAGMQFTYRNPARSTDPSRILPGAAALVVGAKGYLRAPPVGDPEPPSGRVARYSWVDSYAPLRDALAAVAASLRDEGWRAVVVADDNALVDKAAAHRAGVGWWGKNTLLLVPGAGSWCVLGSVVTDAPLPANDAAVADGCGTCTRCATACPTGALDTPGVLDARRCLAWLVQAPGTFPRQHRIALGDRLYGCDDCQEVCPVNKAAARRSPPPSAEPHATARVDVVEVLGASDEELLRRWGRWYIPGRQPRHLRRNALVVLGNAADPGDPRVRAAVTAAAAAPDPLLRGHALWAARRLGYSEVVNQLRGDRDPSVVAEMQGDVPLRDCL